MLDCIHLDHQRPTTKSKDHPLQYGFRKSRSCSQTTILGSESITDSKDRGLALYIASIDVQKAFDIIRHELLLDRLYQLGLREVWWQLKESAYTDLRERVMWQGKMSEAFLIMQGSRQGASLVLKITSLSVASSYSCLPLHRVATASVPLFFKVQSLRVRLVGDHLRPQNSRWSSVVF